jgi:plastocyanin
MKALTIVLAGIMPWASQLSDQTYPVDGVANDRHLAKSNLLAKSETAPLTGGLSATAAGETKETDSHSDSGGVVVDPNEGEIQPGTTLTFTFP